MGLLTIDGCYDGDTRLKIPNYSIQTLYRDFLVKLIAHAKQKAAIKGLAVKGLSHLCNSKGISSRGCLSADRM
jgi:hypothetical protein